LAQLKGDEILVANSAAT